MKRELFIRPLATIDIAEISDYLGTHSRKNAVRFIEDFAQLRKELERDPQSGFRLPKETEVKQGDFWYIRFPRFKNYLVIYRFDQSRTEILRVAHSSRDLPNLLSNG